MFYKFSVGVFDCYACLRSVFIVISFSLKK